MHKQEEIIASIVMPIRNEEEYIAQCIESLLKQDYPKENMEFIFVDGNSVDQTREIIQHYIDLYPKLIKLLDNPNKTVPYAMNIGIKKAKGRYIIRMDAHALYNLDYIRKCIEISQRTNAENVGGHADAKGKGYVGKGIEFSHSSLFGLGGGKFRDTSYSGYVDTVFLGTFKREIFEKVGFYNEHLTRNQDIELNSRIRAHGGECYLSSEIKVAYFCRNSLWELWKQNYKNGVWNVYTNSLNENALSLRHFIPLIFVVTLISSLGLLIVNRVNHMSLFLELPFWIIAGSYLFANLYYSIEVAMKTKLSYFFVMPAVFLVLHFSYGIGSIWGLISLKKWKLANQA